MNKPNIILTGFMGTGKSTIGRLLAEQLDYTFVDTDQIIEQRCGTTIEEIFQTRGEPYFRTLETAIAEELAAKEGLVVATGGKLMLDPYNAKTLGRSGKVFCLTASAEEIIRRVCADTGSVRPLLKADNPTAKINELLAERQAGYAKFYHIPTSHKDASEVVAHLLQILKTDPAAGLLQFT